MNKKSITNAHACSCANSVHACCCGRQQGRCIGL
jgi:hypothetical protein